MDDLLREFLTETSESLDTVDNQLVRFEQDPNNAQILDNIFRLVHTIKGTCGFLGLPRLEALGRHAGGWAHGVERLRRFLDENDHARLAGPGEDPRDAGRRHHRGERAAAFGAACLTANPTRSAGRRPSIR